MGSFRVVFSKDAAKDMKVASRSCYYPKLLELLELLQNDPYKSPPPFKYLEGKLKGCISRRISMQHRLVYKMYGNVVKVVSCWTHYYD